jgi:hypothetical protein
LEEEIGVIIVDGILTGIEAADGDVNPPQLIVNDQV